MFGDQKFILILQQEHFVERNKSILKKAAEALNSHVLS